MYAYIICITICILLNTIINVIFSSHIFITPFCCILILEPLVKRLADSPSIMNNRYRLIGIRTVCTETELPLDLLGCVLKLWC